MDIKGRVIYVGQPNRGISKRTGNEWKSQDVVVQYFEHDTDRYPDSVYFRIFGERIDALNLKVNDEVEAGIGLTAREYDGKYYNEVSCFRLEKVSKEGDKPSQTTDASENAPTTAVESAEKTNNLPKLEATENPAEEGDLPFLYKF